MESVESFHRRFDAAAFTTYTVVMIIVPMKTWCRKQSGGWKNVGLDDYLSGIALLSANVSFWISMAGIRKNLGRQVTDVGTEGVIQLLFYIYLGQIAYVTTIALTKFSILAFYWRLFSLMARIPILIITFCVLAWAICAVFVFIFECNPIRAAWDVTLVPAHTCISVKSFYIGGSVPNVLIDIILLLLPLPYVWRLQAPLTQRIIMATMFMLDIFTVIISVVRLQITYDTTFPHSANITYDIRPIVVWSVVEVNVGLASSCLPSLKPALVLLGLDKWYIFSSAAHPSIGTPSRVLIGEDHQLSNIQSDQTEQSHEVERKGSSAGLFIMTLDPEDSEFRMRNIDSQKTGRQGLVFIEENHDTNDDGSADILKTGGGITV